ncbi:hypothetical protein AAFF_G00172760 [Aldrovandia affinis]|uniref:Reverse transcriptase RNase H-like domain-containing protein n=1 Tax=Aldrovandia affinis TaxID=143900 RepID=A0AAD7WW72_9TELE|nr:hypothetical protein AAFF_G00172760 [Aldrovandia affinis]
MSTRPISGPFARLSEHGLIINLAKCQFGVPVVDFLGHRVTREGRTFTAFVDHKPLALAMAMVKEPWSARQQRQLAFVSEFTTDIQHVAGKDNVVADCLSRSIVDAVNLGVDYGQMAADQASDPEVQALRAATTGLQLQEANGMCERFHRSLKVSLRAALQGDAWFDTLPWVLLGLRTAPKADLGASSAELVYGQPLHVPG